MGWAGWEQRFIWPLYVTIISFSQWDHWLDRWTFPSDSQVIILENGNSFFILDRSSIFQTIPLYSPGFNQSFHTDDCGRGLN